ncbi:MAG: cyclic nucleotide-binding domain-containing protein [Dehalococcoidia bacterium]|nr:cyclic nucleotide-binding domain-containing protein [Dehalococcoidia bacterium]
MTTLSEARNVPARGRRALQRSIAWYLRQLSRVLNVLSDEELSRLIPLLTERQFKPRQVLFTAGDPAERVYLILKGRVKIYQVAENGKEIILDVVGKGALSVIWPSSRTVSAPPAPRQSTTQWPSASPGRTSPTSSSNLLASGLP